MLDRTTKRDVTLEASRDVAKPKMVLKPRKVSSRVVSEMRTIRLHLMPLTEKQYQDFLRMQD